MTMFAVALGAFILLHVGVSATGLRTMLVKGIGEGPYRGLFSIASIAVLTWMLFTYGAARDSAENAVLWAAPEWGRHVAATLVLAGFLLGVTGLLMPGPTSVGFEKSVQKPEPATGILRVTRHPFLWGVSLWGIGHLFANAEATSVMLFGGLAIMALLGTRSIDRKAKARDPEHWQRFAAVTSNVPFAAIVQGRNRFAIGETLPRMLAALIVFGLVAYFHGPIFGQKAFAFGAG